MHAPHTYPSGTQTAGFFLKSFTHSGIRAQPSNGRRRSARRGGQRRGREWRQHVGLRVAPLPPAHPGKEGNLHNATQHAQSVGHNDGHVANDKTKAQPAQRREQHEHQREERHALGAARLDHRACRSQRSRYSISSDDQVSAAYACARACVARLQTHHT